MLRHRIRSVRIRSDEDTFIVRICWGIGYFRCGYVRRGYEFRGYRAGSQLKICPIVKIVSVFVKNEKSVLDASSDDTARTSACGEILWFRSTGTNSLAL